MRRVALLLAVVVGLGTVLPVAPGAAAPTERARYLDPTFAQVTVSEDLVYGSGPDFGGKGTQTLNLDLYQPTGDTAVRRPLLVFAHGGGFFFGDKAHVAANATAYAKRGFVVASIEYRMDEAAGALRYPLDSTGIGRILAAKGDMQAAVRWMRAHAVQYRIDPGKVAVGGISAGAVTASMVAVMSDDPGSSGTPGLSSRVCTAVVISGGGGTNLVDSADAGAIFFHGTADPIVPIIVAQGTEAAMRGKGLPTRFVTYAGAGHDVFSTRWADIEEQSSAWMKARVVDRTSSCAGPVDAAADSFVTAAHHDLLGRAPTATQLAEGVNLLDSGATRSAYLTRLTTSDEWLGAIVTDLYQSTLGRAPDASGLAYWVGTLRSGRYSVAQVAASFYASPEYHGGLGGGTDATWVADLYEEILGRPGTAGDVAYWTSQIAPRGRWWVARQLYDSLESRRARVTDLYEHLLGRAPDAAGLAFWADRVATTGDLALARDLAASAEYRTRAIARFP